MVNKVGRINYLNRTMQSVASNNSDFFVEVGKGNIDGHTPIFFSGENEEVGVVAETVRSIGGRYPFPTSAVTATIVSSSANDNATGTGARTAILLSLDENYEEQAELITLNGLTPVPTTLDLLRVSFFQILTTGTLKTNEGNIDILNVSDNLGRIQAQEGRMRQAVATVPSGKTWFTGRTTFSGGKDDELQVQSFAFDENGVGIIVSKPYVYQNYVDFISYNVRAFPEKFDFELTASKTGSAGNARISCIFEFLEIENNKF